MAKRAHAHKPKARSSMKQTDRRGAVRRQHEKLNAESPRDVPDHVHAAHVYHRFLPKSDKTDEFSAKSSIFTAKMQ